MCIFITLLIFTLGHLVMVGIYTFLLPRGRPCSLSHSELLGLPRAIGQRDSATRAACSGKPAGLRLASSIERPLVGHPGETSFTHSDATSGDQWEPKQNFNAKPLKIKLPLEPQHTKIVQDLQAQPKQSACC